jgi:hypothetical protein
MRYDIIINLDYEGHPHEALKQLFVELQEAMLERGFVMDGRRFTIDLPAEQAQALAREVIGVLEQRYQRAGKSIFPRIKEFFGFEPSNATNLLLPPTEEIHVQELADIEGVEVVDLFKPR